MNLPSVTLPVWATRKRLIATLVTIALLGGGFFVFIYGTSHKTEIALGTLDVFEKVSKLLPLEPDTKKEVSVANTLIQTLTAHNDKTYTFFILLQNNFSGRASFLYSLNYFLGFFLSCHFLCSFCLVR